MFSTAKKGIKEMPNQYWTAILHYLNMLRVLTWKFIGGDSYGPHTALDNTITDYLTPEVTDLN